MYRITFTVIATSNAEIVSADLSLQLLHPLRPSRVVIVLRNQSLRRSIMKRLNEPLRRGRRRPIARPRNLIVAVVVERRHDRLIVREVRPPQTRHLLGVQHLLGDHLLLHQLLHILRILRRIRRRLRLTMPPASIHTHKQGKDAHSASDTERNFHHYRRTILQAGLYPRSVCSTFSQIQDLVCNETNLPRNLRQHRKTNQRLRHQHHPRQAPETSSATSSPAHPQTRHPQT